MPQFDDYIDDNRVRNAPRRVIDRQEQHADNLSLAMRALPSEVVLELVAAGLVSRGDYDAEAVKTFSRAASDWAWPYVTA